MSSECNAVLCFGFIVDSQFMIELESDGMYISDLLNDQPDLDEVWQGSEGNDEPSWIVCIKKSIINTNEYDDPTYVSLKRLEVKDDWSIKLKEFAKKNKMKIGKIGWLLACYST